MNCAVCGHENPDRNRFCGSCGAPLQTPPAPRAVRKVVTVLFADVTGSTGLGERLDPESLRRVMTRYFEEMRAVLERHGGTIEKFIGDAVMAVFGIPELHEDDALRAVRAAAEMRQALAALNADLDERWGVRLQVRTGINTGEVVAGDPDSGQALVVGDAVNVAARLEQAAAPGEILTADATYRLVRDAVVAEPVGDLDLRGKTGGVGAVRLIAVVAGAPGLARRLDSAMVGRQREQKLLRQAFERSREESACHLFTVLGSAGVGKSRLVSEVLRGVSSEADVLTGRCLSYGDGITYWPLTEVVRRSAGISDEDTHDSALEKVRRFVAGADQADAIFGPLTEAMGLAASGSSSEQIFWAARKLLEHLAHARPLVVVFDDIHWAEPTFLDLLEHLSDWSRDAPLLLLCVARPELLDHRPNWGGGKLNATSILLEPLSATDARVLVDKLLGATELPAGVVGRITQAAEGNPLFVEEMLGMLIDEGRLRLEDGRWVAGDDLADITVPPSIQALLAARLDRLQGGVRDVVERAAVIGKIFYRSAVAELSPEPLRHEVDAHLMTLIRKELIRAERSVFAGDDSYRFRHILIRDAAYEAMPKEMRAELHERFAMWLEIAVADRVVEYEEIIAHHLAEAFRYRCELGSTSEATDVLALRAASKLAATAERALDRGDLPAAADLYRRGIALERDVRGRNWPRWVIYLADALHGLGRFAEAAMPLQEAERVATEAGDDAGALRARLFLLMLQQSTDPEGASEEIRRRFEGARTGLEAAGDDETLAVAYSAAGQTHAMSATWIQMERLVERALFHARRCGERRVELDGLRWMTSALYYGPTPAGEAIARLKRMEVEVDDPALRGSIWCKLGALHAMTGDVGTGRAYIERARSHFSEYGLRLGIAGLAFFSAPVEVAAGDLAAAERQLRTSIDALHAMGDRAFSSTLAVFLASAVYEQGRYDEVMEWTTVAEATASSDDAVTQAWLRSVKSRMSARTGDIKTGLSLAREAVEITDATEFPAAKADVREGLAEVLWLSGRESEARRAVEEAAALYEAKGFLVPIERLRSRFASLAAFSIETENR